MRRFWTKVKVILLLVGLVAFSCLVISTMFVNTKLYSETSNGGSGLDQVSINLRKQPKPSDSNPNLKSKLKADENFSKKLVVIAKAIHEAKKHVRGSKTSDFLKQAIENMNDLLQHIGIDHASVYNRSTHAPKSVCPETYMGTTYGYPYFYKGFEVTNCSYGIPVSNLITVVNVFNDNQTISAVQKFVSSVYQMNTNISLVISVVSEQMASSLKETFPRLIVQTYQSMSDGEAWNNLIKLTKTPYVLIARNVEFLTNDSRLDRLVREYESLNVVAISGASRDSNGYWKKGCFQSVYRNFSLRYLEGYDESIHECLFCDYTEGPILTSREYIEQNPFFDVKESGGLFEDWFLNIVKHKHEAVVCPDSMFHVSMHRLFEKKIVEKQWFKMMNKWDLYKMRTPSGHTITRPCPNSKTTRDSSCNVQSNADAVKTIMKVCEENGLICELQEGTALGAVKFEKTLPWERDADITFLTANYEAFQKLKPIFDKHDISLSANGGLWCCVDNRTAGGKFMLRHKGWNIEMYGQHIMDSELMVLSGIRPTKVLLDGQWVKVPRNPGLFMRNRYGREIYQHAQHWMTTGASSGWINYKTNIFQRCSRPGEHHCLDRYNADGDLPFVDVLP